MPENISKGFRIIERTRFVTGRFTKRRNSVKMKVELQYLFSACHLFMFHICTKFRENTSKGFRVIEWTRFVTERFTKKA